MANVIPNFTDEEMNQYDGISAYIRLMDFMQQDPEVSLNDYADLTYEEYLQKTKRQEPCSEHIFAALKAIAVDIISYTRD